MSLSLIVLASGRSLELSGLRMSSTYAGFLEGYPCRRINDMRVSGLLRAAERESPRAPVHLVPPSIEYPEVEAGAFGPVEVLPAVACVGSFHSTPVAADHDPVLYRSLLTVAWFQDSPEVPSGDAAGSVLGDLRWEELAGDDEL
ncbi:hypothetical protein ACFWRV_14910 [Streptomyces sp. NPDC058576]|uniref:hypothetical protein n=1 Tax=Streptomyces sp. NPDC058576 TaxID=3346547 RepID=UPI00365E1B18